MKTGKSADAPDDYRQKIVDWPGLGRMRGTWRRQGRVVVWTNGCFDLIHIGIYAASSPPAVSAIFCGRVNSDDSVRRIKGPGRPVVPAGERTEIWLRCSVWIMWFSRRTDAGGSHSTAQTGRSLQGRRLCAPARETHSRGAVVVVRRPIEFIPVDRLAFNEQPDRETQRTALAGR